MAQSPDTSRRSQPRGTNTAADAPQAIGRGAVAETVENFLGGIVHYVEFKDDDGDENEVGVFVRNRRPTIYWSSEVPPGVPGLETRNE
jgi:hypothetical protein